MESENQQPDGVLKTSPALSSVSGKTLQRPALHAEVHSALRQAQLLKRATHLFGEPILDLIIITDFNILDWSVCF